MTDTAIYGLGRDGNYFGATRLDHLLNVLEAQAAGALRALGPGVVEYPDADSFLVAEGTGKQVTIEAGAGLAAKDTYVLPLYTSTQATCSLMSDGTAFPDNGAIYIYATIENSGSNDTRETRTPKFVGSASSSYNGGLKLASVVLVSGAITTVTDLRAVLSLGGGSGDLEIQSSGTAVGTQPALNFVAGDRISLAVSEDSVNGRVDVTITAETDAAGYGGTATDSLTIGTGAKTLTTQTGLAYLAGNRVRASKSSDSTKYIEGTVTSYNTSTGELVIEVDNVGGSGTVASWNIGIAGDVGATGSTGATGAAGAGYGGTSTTSRSISTGLKSFTTQSGLAYVVGSRVRATVSTDATTWMEGAVTAYSSTTLTVDFDTVNGSGTHASWTFSIAGMTGSVSAASALTIGSQNHKVAQETGSNNFFSNTNVLDLIVKAVGKALRIGTDNSDPVSVFQDNDERVRVDATTVLVATNPGLGAAATTAAFQVDSTTQGILAPRMTSTQRDAISSPATGLLIYNTTTSALNVYTGSAWVAVGSGGGAVDWGDIGGTLADQADLAAELAAKLESVATGDIADDAVTYAKMQNISATARILGRKTAAAGNAEECTLSEVLDMIGSAAQGDILIRGASGWERLPAGTDGYVLTAAGAGANPAWEAASGGGGGTFNELDAALFA